MNSKHCHQCGWVWPISSLPGRNDSCHQCGADMKVCLNCPSYDTRVAHQCRDSRADPVDEKHTANFCEFFDFAKRAWSPREKSDPRADQARNDLKRLLGD